MTPDNLVEKVFDTKLTRRQVLEWGAASALTMTALPGLEIKERQSEIQVQASIEKFNLTDTDAARLIEPEYNRPIEPALTFRELKLEENLNGYLTPEIQFETQGLKEQIDYALGWINDLRIEGADMGLEILFDYDGVNPPKEAAVIMRAKSDLKMGERDVKAGEPIIIREKDGGEFSLHFIKESGFLPGSKIKTIKLNEQTDSQLKAKYKELGYGELITEGAGSWIMAELDGEGNIVQIITEGEAVFLTKKVFVGPVELNVRSEPDPSNNQNIITQTLDANTSIVTPTAPPPELPGNIPGDVSMGIYKEDEVFVTQANGYTWYLVQYSDGRYGWSALDVKNPDTVNVAVGPQMPRESIFRSIDEINYFDFEDKPWERYGITEEEYLETKATVNEYTPQEAIDEAQGKYSHELRGYVKIDEETSDVMVWRPGAGKNGWYKQLGSFKFHNKKDGWLEIILEGRDIELSKRSKSQKGLADLRNIRFSEEEMLNFEKELLENQDRKINHNTKFRDESKIFLQIVAELDEDVDIYKPIALTSNLGDALEALKIDAYYGNKFATGRLFYGLKEEYDNQKDGIAETAISEMIMILTYQFLTNSLGDPKDIIWGGRPVTYRFNSTIENYVSNVLGVLDLKKHAYAVRPRSLILID